MRVYLIAVFKLRSFENSSSEVDHIVFHGDAEGLGNGVLVDGGLLNPVFDFSLALVGGLRC